MPPPQPGPSSTSAVLSSPAPSPPPSSSPPSSPPSSAASQTTSTGSAPANASATLPGNSTVVNATMTSTGPPPLDTGTGIPPLANITRGMATQAILAISTTYAPGATPPISGAPVLPTVLPNQWPPLDRVPDINSPEVQAWMHELDGFNIPDLSPTTNGSCAGDPALAADAANRGWWTCGGYTRDTDITTCPDYLTWGVSFDDGPSPYTQKLLNYLNQSDIHATFFVVGSRCAEYPNILREEYMSGHEISVHTWSHHYLTTLSNEQIVAELGWTRKVIKDTLGITALTMRPPFGDIDDRVRAISLAMGLIPILWTSTPDGAKFDTNDWAVASGASPGNQSVASFNQILTNATMISSGFIVLEHDLFEITVDLAVGYTLKTAQTFQPKLDLQPIGQCNGIGPDNIYLETNTNTSFPYPNKTSGGSSASINVDGSSVGSASASGSASVGANVLTGTGFATTIPVLSSIALGAIAAMSIML